MPSRRAERRLWWERRARSLRSCVSSSHSSNSSGPNRSRGSISRTTRYTWGRVIRGIFFPPVLLQAQQERSTQQAHGYVVMPAGPATGLVFVQAHVALFRLELRFNGPPGTAHIGQGLQGSILGSVGQVVAGFAAVQVPAVDGPVDVAGLAPAGWTHPLGAELIGAGPLASLGHRYLPPGLRRQLSAALPPWSAAARPRARACGAPPGPGMPDWSSPVPPATP